MSRRTEPSHILTLQANQVHPVSIHLRGGHVGRRKLLFNYWPNGCILVIFLIQIRRQVLAKDVTLANRVTRVGYGSTAPRRMIFAINFIVNKLHHCVILKCKLNLLNKFPRFKVSLRKVDTLNGGILLSAEPSFFTLVPNLTFSISIFFVFLALYYDTISSYLTPLRKLSSIVQILYMWLSLIDI